VALAAAAAIAIAQREETTSLGNQLIEGNSIFSDHGSRSPARERSTSLLQYVVHKLYYLLASFTNTMSLN
jgi:hypothetical protein